MTPRSQRGRGRTVPDEKSTGEGRVWMTESPRESKAQRGGKITVAVKAQEGELGDLGPFANYGILDFFCDLG